MKTQAKICPSFFTIRSASVQKRTTECYSLRENI